jgi:Ran GTPase-activating protein (RanGAP) involved in mRNA processing and transport
MANKKANLHILELHLSDCCLKDEEFSIILGSLNNSIYITPSLQHLIYKNNEIGQKTISELKKLLQNPNTTSCLKKLQIENVEFLKK